MHKYIEELTELISNCAMDNTYKMSWCKALVEYSCNHSDKKVYFDKLSELIFKYYWDQTIFFNLEQGSNLKKKPTIIQIVKNEIEKYIKNYDQKPINFIRIKDKINIDVKKISKTLTYDVSWRFLKLENKTYDIYDYKKGDKHLVLKYPDLLKEHSRLLFQLINYRWSQKLEDLNNTPRISQKVRGVDRDKEPKRKSLKKFKSSLDLENPNKICFITDKPIPEKELSIDHIIPWSYMYSDDLWNLVYVNKSVNSSMSNRVKKNNVKDNLIKRNKKLLQILDAKNISNKEVEELRLAIDKNYVELFWIAHQG
ncbi:hypothetical protein N9599_07010 [Candidatus Pelagibacter sp.]|nr:hypothetical protein [Candidatus Pelagibacter sp.]